MKTSGRGTTAIVLIVAALLAIGSATACSGGPSTDDPAASGSAQEQSAQSSGELPALYVQAGLPVYPNGTVTDKREGSNLVDGVQLTWETSDDIATVKSFFDTELAALGLTPPGNSAPINDYAYVGIYTDGPKQFNLQVTKVGDTSNNKIHVNYHE